MSFSNSNMPYGKVAFAGIGEAKRSALVVRSAKELAVEAALAAMQDAGITNADIDGIITASPTADPHFVFASLVAEALNIRPRLATAMQSAGASPCTAVLHAARAIATGEVHTVLICESDSRGSKFKGDKIQALRAARPWTDDFEDPFGLTVPGKYGLIAQRWMHEFGRGPEDLAAVAVAAREHAQRQAYAPKRESLTVEQVLASPIIAHPLRTLDCCPVADWGCAIILTSIDRARDMRQKPVRLIGGAEGHDDYHMHEPQRIPHAATRRSADEAYAMAGIIPSDVDTAQVFDAFSIAAIVAMEELGLCDPGQGGQFFLKGKGSLYGELPTNTTGGMMTWGNAHIIVLPEAIRQVRGDAGINQVAGVKIALAHGIGGPMSLACTLLLAQ